jgi:hypothetical protein
MANLRSATPLWSILQEKAEAASKNKTVPFSLSTLVWKGLICPNPGNPRHTDRRLYQYHPR